MPATKPPSKSAPAAARSPDRKPPPAPVGPKAAVSATRLTPADIDQAQEDALLQLRIGRTVHLYAVAVSAALLFDAFLVLFFAPTLSGAGARDLHSLYFLVVPLFGGLYLSAFGLKVKWDDYQFWPWESHFSVTVGSLGVNAILLYLYFAGVFRYGPTGSWILLPYFYPLSLLGLTLPLLGLALTWEEWGNRKAASVGAAIAPVLVAFVVLAPSLTRSSQVYALALSLATGSVLYQMTGSFLHLMASGTRAHEREVLTSGQSRLAKVADELRRREEAMVFRESTLLGREADVENAEIALQRKTDALEESRSHATALETEVQTRSTTLQRLQRELAVKLAETNSRTRLLEDRETSLDLREKDLSARLPKVSQREADAIRRQGELALREAEIVRKSQEVAQRGTEASELEGRLAARRQEIERKTQELLQREGSLAAKSGPGPTPTAPKGEGPKDPEREARLETLKKALDEQNVALAQKASEIRTQRTQLEQDQASLREKHEAIELREAEVAQKEADATERTSLAEGRIRRYEETLRQVEQKVQAIETKAAILTQREDEANRREAELNEREKSLAAHDGEIAASRSDIEARIRDLAVKEKRVGSLEDELRYRRQAWAQGVPPTLGNFSIAFAPAGEPPRRGARSSEGRRGRSSSPPPVVPFEEPAPDEAAAPAEPAAPAEAETLQAPALQRFADRAPTGTPRLDDLLLGGIPPKGHLMLIGDAFVGKETAIYAFLAEGLKLGEPAIVITANRGPDELAQKIGVVAPQLQEYEQLGMVRWIDASAAEAPDTAAPETSGARLRTNGPHDHPGILSALVQAANAFQEGSDRPVRVAFFGLSATLAHGDERQRLQFLQNFVGGLKNRHAIALYALETGTVPESQLETVLSRMDGAIYFKREGGKTFLSVRGVGEVQTRDWIEYRATNRALVIGSFSLERIR